MRTVFDQAESSGSQRSTACESVFQVSLDYGQRDEGSEMKVKMVVGVDSSWP